MRHDYAFAARHAEMASRDTTDMIYVEVDVKTGDYFIRFEGEDAKPGRELVETWQQRKCYSQRRIRP